MTDHSGVPHGMGLVQNATSGLVWINEIATGVVSPTDEDHDGRLALLVEGEGITNDDRIDLQLIFGDPTKMANAGIHLLGSLLTEANMQEIANMIRVLVREQRDNHELPHLIEQFSHLIFTEEEQKDLYNSFYNPNGGGDD